MKTYRVFDGSYALSNVAGEMKPTSGNELGDREFSVLASGCDLPAAPAAISRRRNNIILVDIKSGQIVFTQRRFLREIRYCFNCGYEIKEEED